MMRLNSEERSGEWCDVSRHTPLSLACSFPALIGLASGMTMRHGWQWQLAKHSHYCWHSDTVALEDVIISTHA
jgi:hypothetical protein